MMRVVLVFLVLLIFAWAPPALARCVGTNMLPDLRASDPDGIEQIFAAANAVPNAVGRFWKVTRADVAPSYLFGTFHSPEAIGTVPDNVWTRLDAARIAIFELSQAEQASLEARMLEQGQIDPSRMNQEELTALIARMSTDITFAIDPTLPPLQSVINDKQREVLSKAFAARGMSLEQASQMRPWMLASLLGFPACHLTAMAGGETILDAHMAQRAIENGVEETGLETFDVALEAFSGLTRDQLVAALAATDNWIDIEEDIFRTNTDLYASGRIQAINEFALWLAERENPPFDVRALNKAMMDGLLDQRNLNWMPKIKTELAKGNAFIAVGALHLPGEVGLVELIRADGYQVDRLDTQ